MASGALLIPAPTKESVVIAFYDHFILISRVPRGPYRRSPRGL